jgi:hypothetical protein
VVAIGMGVSWFGYAVALYGYCLAKQYKVGFLQLVAPTTDLSWPPPLQDDVVNNQEPQPTVAEQYLAPLTLVATALASLVGTLGSAVGGAAGLVNGAGSAGTNAIDDAAAALGLPEPFPRNNPPQPGPGGIAGAGAGGAAVGAAGAGSGSGGGTPNPWGVTDLTGGGR